MHIHATIDPEQMPSPAAVARLYAMAAAPAPLRGDPSVARAFATLYAWARALPGAASVAVRDGADLAAFGYGYSWDWSMMTDAWALDLHDRLGGAARVLDDSFSIVLLTVAPSWRGRGAGRRLLDALVDLVDEEVTWVVTSRDARAFYERAGWSALGEAPAAADGTPALVLTRRTVPRGLRPSPAPPS